MNLTLIRDAGPAPLRTFGEMHWADEQIVLQTLERPWIPDPRGAPGGHPFSSCVPLGTYDLVLHDTPAHPQTWALSNPALGVYHEPGDIPTGQIGRVAVLLHTGNVVADSLACILLGLSRSTLNGEPDVTDSRAAFAELKAAVPWVAGHTVTITQGDSP